MKSDQMKSGIMRAPHRSLLKAVGYTTDEIKQPLIGVVNSFNTIIAGHVHLNAISDAVKSGIYMAGGTPMEFGCIGVCDGIAMNHEGMKYSLASRELIADSIETMVMAHALDAIVLIPNCDKIVPGMLMAAARLNLPAIVISGGPMLRGEYVSGSETKKIDLVTVFESVGAVLNGKMSEDELLKIEESACPTCGSCAGMFTANSMNCLTEVLGMGLPGNGTIPAVMSARIRLAKMAGVKILELTHNNITPKMIMTQKAFENAFTLDMALGCSTNTVLHLTAIASELDIEIDLNWINDISKKTPYLCSLSPSGNHHIQDLHQAGGIHAVLNELFKGKLLNRECLTVTGKTIHENASLQKDSDPEVIRPVSNPYKKDGGLAVLFGNIAPNGCVVKQSAIDPSMRLHEGPARVFDSEEDATQAIEKGEIHKKDVVVIRFEGPKGGPGMREMLTPTSAICGMGLAKDVALITDGRFSGGTQGACVGHISPEAMAKGPIAIIEEGDIILIDINEKKITLQLTDDVIQERLKHLKTPPPKVRRGYLSRYAQLVSSADKGAILKINQNT